MNLQSLLKKSYLFLLAIVFLAGASGCVGYGRIVISSGMPAPRMEKHKRCPSANHQWAPGHWKNVGHERWQWSPGGCVPPGHQKTPPGHKKKHK